MILNHVRLVRELADGMTTEDGYVRVDKGIIREVSGTAYNLKNKNHETDK